MTTEAPKKGSPLKLAMIGCCGCLFALTAFLALVIGLPLMATGPAVEVARGHLTGAAADPAATYAACASSFKASTTEAAFKAFVAAHPELYKAADLTFSSRSFDNGFVRLQGTATSSTGATAPLAVQLVKEGDAWRVTSVGSPDRGAEPPVDTSGTDRPPG